MRELPRFKTADVCGECGICKGTLPGQVCEPARVEKMRPYSGIRLTSDGFDCALPVTIDSHSHCAYGCLYCFADNLTHHQAQCSRPIGQTSLKTVERLFAGDPRGGRAVFQRALKYEGRAKGRFPCPVQIGAINDPCDHIERQQGWLLSLIELAQKYEQPVRISTKGTVLSLPEYQAALARDPRLFWVSFSITTPDDVMLAMIDRRAPSATERLRTMAELSALGVRTSLRLRPMLPGVTDRTARFPQAWKVLLEKAREAGACAVSCEVAFMPGGAQRDVARRWLRLSTLTGIDFKSLYRSFGPTTACMRPAYTWTEEVMHRVVEHAHSLGMVVGVSDPVWKQLTDTGCCCGILPDDPIFGNWQRESMTNQLLVARDTGREVRARDAVPAWAYDTNLTGIIAPGVGPTAAYRSRHMTWADKLLQAWNDVESPRGPLQYFQGAMLPVRWEHGNLVYKYVGLQRTGFKAKEWHLE